jgi:oxygen-independent coproporphyrinogen III oxidase
MTSSTFTQDCQPALGAMPSAELISRYDRPGPRYTSYPTAAEFKDTFTESDRLAAIASAAPGPLSAYVHVPFCSSPCFYCACTKVITRRLDMADAYVNRLEREIEWVGNQFDGARPLQQLHFGGGTPTFLNIDHLSCIFGSLDRHFGLISNKDREYSIEIDPRTVQPATMAELAGLGLTVPASASKILIRMSNVRLIVSNLRKILRRCWRLHATLDLARLRSI